MRRLTLIGISVGIVLDFAAFLPARASGPLGGQTASTSNEVRVTSETPGPDLGAKINAAVADCGRRRCDIWVDQPGTISTSPDVPQGDSIHFSPGTYTLATTWYIKHSGTIYDFNGAVFNDIQDSPDSFAIKVGKSSSGIVDTDGKTVRWISGANFSDIDPNDLIDINGANYNVASVQSSTELTITANAGSQTGMRYFGIMTSNLPIGHMTTVVLRGLSLNHKGKGSGRNSGIFFEGVVKPFVENVQVDAFKNGTAWLLLGVLDGTFLNIQARVNSSNLILGQMPSFSGSNLNTFISAQLGASTTAEGNAIAIQNSSTLNTFIGADVEANRSTVAVLLDNTAFQEHFENCDFERNGDGTANSRDVSNFGSLNTFEDCAFASSPENYPASGIISGTGSRGTIIRSCRWVGRYGTSYEFEGMATGRTENNFTVGAHREPAATP